MTNDKDVVHEWEAFITKYRIIKFSPAIGHKTQIFNSEKRWVLHSEGFVLPNEIARLVKLNNKLEDKIKSIKKLADKMNLGELKAIIEKLEV